MKVEKQDDGTLRIMPAAGRKHDIGKPRMELLPFSVLVEISKVLTHGANKYAPDNWQKVPDAKNRYTGALMRHLAAWKEGENVDPESGEDKLLHIAQVACNALFLVWFETHDSKLEDKNEEKMAEVADNG
jgi:hypothetical protein